MAIQIQFRRGTAFEWHSVNPKLAEGEMGIETDTNLFKIGNGNDFWDDLDYGGIRGYTGSRSTASFTMAVSNVLYVSKTGNDANDGLGLNTSLLTIKAAAAIATRGTTIFVKSGDYVENTPITVPDFVSIVGDNLRSVNVRSTTATNDIFYVNNGVYIAHMTFHGHQAPAAAIAFPADGSAGVISTSPYVQNCTSMTTDGTGMRVDGDLALGTKSMVVDAFTQYNQGGIGIHMLNNGYTQLVSVFTICCDKGFLCESGGFCSITNSNSSFGNYALYADGVGATKYSGKVVGSTSGRTFVIDNLGGTKPAVGDAMSFGDGNYYTVASSTAFKTGSTDVVYPVLTPEDAGLRNARQTVLNEKTKLQILTINHVLETFPGFDFNQFKCSRDVGTIITSVCYDMVLNTNYQSVKAGSSYYRAVGSTVITEQLTETLSAVNFLKLKVLALLTPATTAYTRISDLFDIILDIMANGLSVEPALTYNPPTGVTTATVNAVTILQANRDFIAEETVAYTNNFTYNAAKCYRDTGLIVDSIAFDLFYGGTSQSVFAGLQYWNKTGYTGEIARELTTTSLAIAYARDLTVSIATLAGGAIAATTVTNNFNTLLDILNLGTAGVTDLIIPNGAISTDTNTVAAYNAIISNKTTIQNNTIVWIDSNYPAFSYNVDKCSRDTGLIVDSVAFDILYGSTSQSTFAGLQYWSQNGYTGAIAEEITTTTNAIRYLSTLTCNIAEGVGFATARAAVQSKFNILLSTLDDVSGVTDNIVPNGVASTNATVLATYDAILANKSTLQSEVIDWINTNNPDFSYNTSTCYRDVGYIIDSIAFDYLHGGNRQSIMSAVYYYGFDSTSTVIASEIPQTIAAYNFIKSLASSVIRGIPVTTYQTAVTQTITSNTATVTEAALISDKIDVITTIINTGPVGVTKVPIELTPINDNMIANAFTLLLSNRTFIRAETIAYVNKFFSYDRDICRRDVGYIVDSVAFDLLHGGNRQSVTSGVYYYGFDSTSTAIVNEIPQTTAAYDFIRDISADIIKGNVITGTYQSTVTQTVSINTATNVEVGLINGKISTITNIIKYGPSVAPSKVPISLIPNTSTNVINAFNLLLANRAFIQAETIAYVNTSYVGLVYSTATCKRDVGYIIDAVSYDLMYGGNSQTANAADAYYDGSGLKISSREKLATIAAYEHIKDIIDEVLVNILITYKFSDATQIDTYPSATPAESARAQSLVDIVANIVENDYSSTVVLQSTVGSIINDNTVVTFHQYSQIQSSAHNFEWIGAGTNINAALPYLGGEPNSDNQAVAINGGRVYYTGTDQKGDFRIGNDLVINNSIGTISGRTFTKSLFAVMTPYILAIGS